MNTQPPNIVSLKKLGKIVSTLNTIKKKTSTKLPVLIPTDQSTLENLRNGITFIYITLWKIFAIISDKGISQEAQVDLIINLRDPNGRKFISERGAMRIYRRSRQIIEIFKDAKPPAVQDGGGKITTRTWIFTPLKALEQRYGHHIEVPLELTSSMLSALSTLLQLISSTVVWVTAPPPFGWIPDVVGNVTVAMHVGLNTFNLFLNIARANWPIAIQTAQGMFPHFLITLNGLTLQLMSAKRMLRIFGKGMGVATKSSETMVPILLPILQNPIHFMNPLNMAKYTSHQVKRLMKN